MQTSFFILFPRTVKRYKGKRQRLRFAQLRWRKGSSGGKLLQFRPPLLHRFLDLSSTMVFQQAQGYFSRHCERSEAIFFLCEGEIATPCGLAMTFNHPAVTDSGLNGTPTFRKSSTMSFT